MRPMRVHRSASSAKKEVLAKPELTTAHCAKRASSVLMLGQRTASLVLQARPPQKAVPFAAKALEASLFSLGRIPSKLHLVLKDLIVPVKDRSQCLSLGFGWTDRWTSTQEWSTAARERLAKEGRAFPESNDDSLCPFRFQDSRAGRKMALNRLIAETATRCCARQAHTGEFVVLVTRTSSFLHRFRHALRASTRRGFRPVFLQVVLLLLRFLGCW
jgi:hypothetical protein